MHLSMARVCRCGQGPSVEWWRRANKCKLCAGTTERGQPGNCIDNAGLLTIGVDRLGTGERNLIRPFVLRGELSRPGEEGL